MSFTKTTQQVRDHRKDVTRRPGWEFLKPGDEINACVKCQGLRKGQKVERICRIRVRSVRRERLRLLTDDPNYGRDEMRREGFPCCDPADFVRMFIALYDTTPSELVTRIEFEYVTDSGLPACATGEVQRGLFDTNSGLTAT